MITLIDEAGTYACRVVPQTADEPYFQEIGRDKTDAVVLHLITLDGQQKAVWNGWLSPNAAPYTKKRLEELFGADWLDQIEAGVDPFADKEVSVVTEIEYYKGKSQCKVKYLNRPGAAGAPMAPRKIAAVLKKLRAVKDPEPRAQADAPAFDQPLRRVVHAKDMGESPALRRQAQQPLAELADDDIPF